jgi:hypothetical protein
MLGTSAYAYLRQAHPCAIFTGSNIIFSQYSMERIALDLFQDLAGARTRQIEVQQNSRWLPTGN